MFDLGDTVVCVNDSDPPQGTPPHVVKGQTYTVSGVGLLEIEPGVYMQTIFVAELPTPFGVGWFAFRFRKVQKKKADISIFTKILDKINKTEPEKV